MDPNEQLVIFIVGNSCCYVPVRERACIFLYFHSSVSFCSSSNRAEGIFPPLLFGFPPLHPPSPILCLSLSLYPSFHLLPFLLFFFYINVFPWHFFWFSLIIATCRKTTSHGSALRGLNLDQMFANVTVYVGVLLSWLKTRDKSCTISSFPNPLLCVTCICKEIFLK